MTFLLFGLFGLLLFVVRFNNVRRTSSDVIEGSTIPAMRFAPQVKLETFFLCFALKVSTMTRGRHWRKRDGLLTYAENPVNNGIVATVAHGQPVADEEHDVDKAEAETR